MFACYFSLTSHSLNTQFVAINLIIQAVLILEDLQYAKMKTRFAESNDAFRARIIEQRRLFQATLNEAYGEQPALQWVARHPNLRISKTAVQPPKQ